MPDMSRHLRIPAAFLTALVLAGGAVGAQQATLTLFPEAAVWNDVIEARIEGVGCTGEAEVFVHELPGVGWVIDIDLLHCSSGSTTPFSAVVELGPLFPRDYTVQLQNSIRHIVSPPPPPFDTATLKVYREASLDVVLPDVATDAAPFTLTFRGPASSSCFQLEPPAIQGRTITAHFVDNCPILPIPGPHIFAEEFQFGPLPAGEYEIRFFEFVEGESRPRLHRQTLFVYDADECAPSDTVLCLQGGRFKVEVNWKDFQNKTGKGHAIPLEGRDDSGLFWYFHEDNIELTVKILNGCGLGPNGGHWWVFLSSGSTVGYTVTVTDTLTDRTKTYTNESGEAAPLVADTSAFSCVP
jgi:hypothetical protein